MDTTEIDSDALEACRGIIILALRLGGDIKYANLPTFLGKRLPNSSADEIKKMLNVILDTDDRLSLERTTLKYNDNEIPKDEVREEGGESQEEEEIDSWIWRDEDKEPVHESEAEEDT